ncbi:MAG TPA: 4-hydroxy-tetrahydrodipicolinate synthase [Bacteroidia bacterium]|nr:4-hydroxy-tetrahydrodipicolinate synthase [Bacteroidia bacterium]HRS59547.1 4-hydroxy-tetrahydrodipicolinate synthase [Bacteroidia bacterium]HRU67663.1 4-hydroxy-tetrahydrodipicolinate synthase [Bacteroidia bacterium]
MKFKGLGVAVITPFTKSLDVDIVAFENIIHQLISNGADYLVLLGTTAETPTLSPAEKRQMLSSAIKINAGKKPVVAGIGGNNTLKIIEEIKSFDFTGIDGILSVVPYYNKPNQKGIYNHFKTIAEACPVPIILYNIPGRTGVNMTAETTLKLANDFKNIQGVKEASGNLDQIMEIIKNKPENFAVISGDDNLTLPLIALGADGVISVIGNAFPDKLSKMISIFPSHPDKAALIHYELMDFIKYLFVEGNPAGIKGLMSLMGYCEKTVRPPLYELSDDVIHKFLELLQS